jgi:uncharacterized protein (DUF2336 family)
MCLWQIPRQRLRNASQSLIDELTGACADVDLGRRAAILMRLTNLFISGRAAYDEQQIALFDDVLIRLSEQVEIVARKRLSERLAAISDPPCGIIRTLAKDQNIEVALPVLTDCELDDDTLTEVATKTDKAICRPSHAGQLSRNRLQEF